MNVARIQLTERAGFSLRSIDITVPFDAPTLASTVSSICEAARPRAEFRDAYEGAREDLLDWKNRALRAEASLRSPVGERIKIAGDGSHLPTDYTGTDHVAVLFPRTRLMVAVESLGDPTDPEQGLRQAECIARCEQYSLLGKKWSAPTRSELASLIDDTRRNPAIDVNYFPRVKPRWHWTCTDLACDAEEEAPGSSPFAWGVYLYHGYVYDYARYGRGFGLPVCRVGQ